MASERSVETGQSLMEPPAAGTPHPVDPGGLIINNINGEQRSAGCSHIQSGIVSKTQVLSEPVNDNLTHACTFFLIRLLPPLPRPTPAAARE